MTRVDEALRRAAEETTGAPSPAGAAPAPTESDDIDTLASEPFPTLVNARPASPPHAVTPHAAPRPEPVATRRAGGQPTRGEARLSMFDRIDNRLAEKIVLDQKMDPASREQYRRLAAVLHDAQTNGRMQVVMLASAVASEGKTLTATNLALTLSESYMRRVLLIDADLRKPALHTVFKINTTTGLSDGLRAEGTGSLVVRQLTPRLSLLPGGRPDNDPMAGLTSERMRKLIDEARETFDWVIIDTPPLVLLPDANLLSSMVDGAVLVVRAESTPHHLVKRAVDAIGHRRILGVVLNQANHKEMPYGGYYNEYFAGGPTELS